MLNYNYNIIIPTANREKKAADFRNNWYWSFIQEEQTFAQIFPEQTSGSFTLDTTDSNAYGIISPSNGYFLAPSAQSVTASLTGSGTWPTTGSYTMSLSVYGITRPPLPPITFYTQSLASEADGNIAALSGSAIKLSFLSSQQTVYIVSGSIFHKKGNIFNPLVNWKNVTINKKPSGSGQFTFNVVKNVNESLVSGSNTANEESGSFEYKYAFNVTSSLTGSVVYDDWYQAQTTMSLSIPEVGIDRKAYFTGSVSGILTASFVATTDVPYTITSSVESKYVNPIYIETFVIGGGGGGAAGGVTNTGTLLSYGAGGGAGSWKEVQFWIRPNLYYTASAGIAGTGGLNVSGSINGGNGTTSSLVYFTSVSSSTSIVAPGGLGGNGITGKGGQSGDGFEGGNGLLVIYTPGANPTPFGGGGGGTIGTGSNAVTGSGGSGGPYLGGGGGAQNPYPSNWVVNSSRGAGAPSPSSSIVSGDAGFGGYTFASFPNPPVNYPGSTSTAFGGGGGGGWGSNNGSTNGGNGGSGVIVLKYQATSSLLTFDNNAYTTEIRDGYVYHYITGSDVKFAYVANPT